MTAPHEHNWRLLNTGFQSGAMNMAIDEAILQAHARGEVPPTLRFYGWQPPAVSIGYFQRMAAEVDSTACRRQGFDAVRRITGGRAILHFSEVTYSVVIKEELLPGSVLATYQVLAQGLLAGLRAMGVPVELAVGEPDPRLNGRGGAASDDAGAQEDSGADMGTAGTPSCFDLPSAYELVVNGAKIVGSAQTRRAGVILQHGSILLDIDPDQVFSVLKVPPEQKAAAIAHLRQRATGVRQVLEEDLPWTEVRDAVLQGFATALELNLQAARLTAGELAVARELAATRYGNDDWNLRR